MASSKRAVAFVQMQHARTHAERAQRSIAADAQRELLNQTGRAIAAVQPKHARGMLLVLMVTEVQQ
jgi:hypothetical protein